MLAQLLSSIRAVNETGKTTLYVVSSEAGTTLYDPDHDRFLSVNTTGIEIWQQISDGKSPEEVARSMALHYGVELNRVEEDVGALIRRINAYGLDPRSTVLIHPHTLIPTQQRREHPTFPWYGQAAVTPRPKPPTSMIVSAFVGLVAFDIVTRLLSFKRLCAVVEGWKVNSDAHATESSNNDSALGQVCTAVNRAALWYPRRVRCLERSAVTTCLLRNKSIAARMVVGFHAEPFSAHAWVEADGSVVNDFPAVRSYYETLHSY